MTVRFVSGTALACAIGLAYAVSTSAQAPSAPAGAQRTQAAPAAAVKTPRTADGRPDLNGVWGFGGGGLPPGNGLASSNTVTKGNQQIVVFGVPGGDFNNGKGLFKELDRQAIVMKDQIKNRPPYKPEFQAKVKELQDLQAKFDPSFYCMPDGVPRVGVPNQIVQTPGQVVFLYSGRNTFRVIPTDGRPHRDDVDPSWMGDSVGRWEGDTLVVDVTNFTDESWLGSEGWIHSDKMHVVERYRREGDTLHYSATVEDPVYFTGPWEMTPRQVRLLTDKSEALMESPPCIERSRQTMVTDEHH